LQTPLVVALDGPIARADLPRLCARVGAQIDAADGGVVECDLRAAAADAVTVEALARLRLLTRRHACSLRLRGAPPELFDLIDFMGLRHALTG
jgi:ABC-type transporter Mla MlaB component